MTFSSFEESNIQQTSRATCSDPTSRASSLSRAVCNNPGLQLARWEFSILPSKPRRSILGFEAMTSFKQVDRAGRPHEHLPNLTHLHKLLPHPHELRGSSPATRHSGSTRAGSGAWAISVESGGLGLLSRVCTYPAMEFASCFTLWHMRHLIPEPRFVASSETEVSSCMLSYGTVSEGDIGLRASNPTVGSLGQSSRGRTRGTRLISSVRHHSHEAGFDAPNRDGGPRAMSPPSAITCWSRFGF
jgi:hypothetical protein